MRAALARGEEFFVQRNTAPVMPDTGASKEGMARTPPVYVIVPGGCASACLDALDLFTRFPNTVLIGAPSSGDSPYMEARSELLPSRQGYVIIPMKAWVHRPRGSGEFYSPDIEVLAVDWSTAAFRDAIERDLRQPAPRAKRRW
jgi:hypothetical protein